MRNVCPHCGKIIEAGEQAFDLTEFLGDQVKRYLNSRVFKEENEIKKYIIGMETFFNRMKTEYPLVFTENDLWNMPSIEPESSTIVKTILFRFPYAKVREHMKVFLRNDPDLEAVSQWFEAKASLMKVMVFKLNLRKMAEGNIRFDTIADDFDATPIARTRVCPHEGCHGKLSIWAGRYEEICMSVLGGPRVSKTTTLTAMANVFLQGYQGIRWEGSDSDDTYADFETSCLTYYKKGLPIEATEISKNNIPRISFRVTLGNVGHIVLTFVDLPGELNNERGISAEMFRRYQHFFDNVDFVWYCTDPAELVGLQVGAQEGNSADQLGYTEGRAALRTAQICNNMNQMHGFFAQAGKVIPVAYILGKTDSELITPSDKQQYHLFISRNMMNRQRPEDALPLDLEAFHREASLVRDYMHQKNPTLVETFKHNFPESCFFSMSAYGWNPKETKEARTPEAYKCTFPFIWMLACKGYIPISVQVGKEQKRVFLNNCSKRLVDDILYNLYMKGNYRII